MIITFVVFDTNVLISGYLWKGKSREAIKAVRRLNMKLLYCKDSLAELVRILSAKFKLETTELYAIVSDIKTIGKEITIVSQACPIKEDPTDNLFINLALDGKAGIIVSGDSHILKLKKYKEIEIMSVNAFVSGFASDYK